ncbi:MAG TPA: hypothetical protein PKW90_18015 [Myxococcota bacterium]|nr:hypothetical protein [Myxococcota bacterium]
MIVFVVMICRIALFSLLLALPGMAFAGSCPTPYNGAQLLNDIQLMQLSLRNEDDASFATAAGRLDSGMACLTTAAPPQVFATAYRLMGVWYWYKQDNGIARRWIRSSLELDPSFQFGADDLAPDHPIRAIFDEERNNLDIAEVPVDGMVLNVPAGSRLVMDGRALDKPAATLNRFHVVQQVGTDNGVRAVWLIAGNSFPETLMHEAGAAPVAEAPKEKKKKKGEEEVAPATTGGVQVQRVERQRPPEKTPIMVAGGVMLVGAGAVYATAIVLEQQFHPPDWGELKFQNEADMNAAGNLVNGLILGAGGLALAGLGVGYWGITIGDSGFGVHFATDF